MRTGPSREVCGLLQHLFLIRYRYHWSSASIAWIKYSLWNWSHQVQVLTLSSYQPGCEFRQGTLWSVISCMLQTRHQGTEMLRCMGQDFHVNPSEELASTPCDHWGGDMFRDPAILSKVCVWIVQQFFSPHDGTSRKTILYESLSTSLYLTQKPSNRFKRHHPHWWLPVDDPLIHTLGFSFKP